MGPSWSLAASRRPLRVKGVVLGARRPEFQAGRAHQLCDVGNRLSFSVLLSLICKWATFVRLSGPCPFGGAELGPPLEQERSPLSPRGRATSEQVC